MANKRYCPTCKGTRIYVSTCPRCWDHTVAAIFWTIQKGKGMKPDITPLSPEPGSDFNAIYGLLYRQLTLPSQELLWNYMLAVYSPWYA